MNSKNIYLYLHAGFSRLMIIIMCIMVLLHTFALSPVWAIESLEETREKNIAEQIRCITCEHENIVSSRTEFAKSARAVIKERISQGYSDEEIIGYFIDKYGQYISFKPSTTGYASVIWLMPYMLYFIAICLVYFVMRRNIHFNVSSDAYNSIEK